MHNPEPITLLATHTVHQRPEPITFSLGLVNLPIFAPSLEQRSQGQGRVGPGAAKSTQGAGRAASRAGSQSAQHSKAVVWGAEGGNVRGAGRGDRRGTAAEIQRGYK